MVLPTRPGRGNGENGRPASDLTSSPGPNGVPLGSPKNVSNEVLDALVGLPEQSKTPFKDFSEPLEDDRLPKSRSLPSLPPLPTLPSRPVTLPELPTTESPEVTRLEIDDLVVDDSDAVDVADDWDWDSISDAPEAPVEPTATIEEELDEGYVAGLPEDFDESFNFVYESNDAIPDSDSTMDEKVDFDEFLEEVGLDDENAAETEAPRSRGRDDLPEYSLDQDEVNALLDSLGIDPAAAGTVLDDQKVNPISTPEDSGMIDDDDEWNFDEISYDLPEVTPQDDSSANSSEFEADDFEFGDLEVISEDGRPSEDSEVLPEDELTPEDLVSDEPEDEAPEEEVPEDLIPEPVRKNPQRKKAKQPRKGNPLVRLVAALLGLLSKIPLLGKLFALLIPVAWLVTILLILGLVALIPLTIFNMAGNGLVEETIAEGPDGSSVELSEFAYQDGEASALVTNTGDTIANVEIRFDLLRYAPTFDPSTWWSYEKVTSCSTEEVTIEIEETLTASASCSIDNSGIAVRVHAEASF